MPVKPLSQTAATDKAAVKWFIFVTIFLDILGVALIIPVLVPLIGTLTTSAGEQAFWYMCVTLIFSLTSFFTAPILGALSDHFGRRKILLIGFLGFSLTWYGTALAPSVWFLLIVRIIAGCMQANLGVARAYIADITPKEKRAHNFGLMGATIGLSFVIGPAIGGMLGSYSLTLPFYVAGTLSIINLIYGVFVLPESLPPHKRKSGKVVIANPLGSILAAFTDKKINYLLLILLADYVIRAIVSASFILYTEFKFGWGPKQNGIALFCSGIMMILTQGVTLKPLLKIFGNYKLCLIAALNGVLAFFIMGMANVGWLMFVAIFIGIINNAIGPLVQAMISAKVEGHNQGKIMGVTSSMNSFSNVLGPLFGPLVMNIFLYSGAAVSSHYMGAPFFIIAALYAAVFVYLILNPAKFNQ